MKTYRQIREVEIATLRPTIKFHEGRARAYTERLLKPKKNAPPCPPITVLANGEVIDGHHRLEAHRRAGRTMIWARVAG